MKNTFSLASMSLIALAVSAHVNAADEAFKRSVEERLTKLEQQSTQEQEAATPANVSFSGLVEVEGSVGEVDNESYSDLVVATVELGVEAQINDKVSAEVVALYEEGETELDIDVATINIAKLMGPVDLTLGKMYVPFGRYETALVNDTLVLELGETNKTAALFGAEKDGLSGGFYVFNGDADRQDHVENYGITLSFEQDNLGLGLDYLSALTESDGLSEEVWIENEPGVAISGHLSAGSVKLVAEYMAATSEIQREFDAEGFEPSVFQLEADLDADINGQTFTFAIAYQQTDDAVALGLPEQRLSVGASTEIYENVSLGAEFWHDEDYSIDDNGSGADGDNIVVQLAVEF